MNNQDRILYSFLKENSDFTEDEFLSLSEDAKIETIKEMTKSILSNIVSKISNFQIGLIDSSKGDIKQFKELDSVQSAISQLENLIEKSQKKIDPTIKEYLSTIIHSILYLNKMTPEFKEAYRNKKTILIAKYESIVLSVISALTYLISVMVDTRAEKFELKNTIVVEDIAPFKALRQFNSEFEKNDFKVILKDTETLREFYNEIPLEKMEDLLEAEDILDLVLAGMKNIVGSTNTTKLVNLLYKTAGVISIILSLRGIIYMLSRSSFNFQDMIQHIKNFVKIKHGDVNSRFAGMGSRVAIDFEEASRQANDDIKDENREIAKVARTTSSISYDTPEESISSNAASSAFDF